MLELRRGSTLDVLGPLASLLRRCLLCPRDSCGCLRRSFLIVLPHYGVTRLVTVLLALPRLLLLHRPGIPVS